MKRKRYRFVNCNKLNVARMDMENVHTCNHITKGVFLKPAEFVV